MNDPRTLRPKQQASALCWLADIYAPDIPEGERLHPYVAAKLSDHFLARPHGAGSTDHLARLLVFCMDHADDVAALLSYAKHKDDCASAVSNGPCTCGFESLRVRLAAAEGRGE